MQVSVPATPVPDRKGDPASSSNSKFIQLQISSRIRLLRIQVYTYSCPTLAVIYSRHNFQALQPTWARVPYNLQQCLLTSWPMLWLPLHCWLIHLNLEANISTETAMCNCPPKTSN